MKARLLFVAALAVLGCARAVGAAERDVQDLVYLGDRGPVLVRLHVRIDGKPLVEVWEKFMDQLFAYLDTDGDGVLNRTEAARVPPAQLLFGNALLGQRGNRLEAPDRNGDGKVTRQELVEWYRQSGAQPFQFQGGGNFATGMTLFVSAGQSPPLSADALNEKLFTLLDANKDGKLSREELARAPEVLRKLDLDDDEMVSAQEMSGNVDRTQEFAVARTLAFLDQPANTGPFVLVKSEGANKELAQRLLNQYGRKEKQTPAKKLKREDLGLDEATFEQLDQDEDGYLDREELACFAQRPPDLELRVRLGKKGEREPAIELVGARDRHSPLARSLRTGTSGVVQLELGTTQIEIGSADPSNESQAISAKRVRQEYLARFNMADKDNNGYLDKNEAMQNPLYRNAFTLMDRDGDGKLFQKEVNAYLDHMEVLQAGSWRSCASLAVKDRGRGLFDMVDSNSDGRLSVRELRQMVPLIDQLDRDGDGQLGRDEIPHKYRVDVQLGPSPRPSVNQRVVVLSKFGGNRDVVLPTRTGPRWFQRMDRNHDGDVSRQEFLGTEDEFRRIDRDGDGLISATEAQQADERFRKAREQKPWSH